MLASHRHGDLLSLLKAEGRVYVTEAAGRLQVAEETIRRDLKLLESQGLVRRIHGGAIMPRPDQEEPLTEREKVNNREKSRIGALAAPLVKDGMSIFLDTGTTTLALARRLVGRPLKVTTNSLDIAFAIRHPAAQVNVVPGTLRMNDNALMGMDTLDHVRRHVFDIAFMGIGACNGDHGWMDYEEAESSLRRLLLAQSARGVLLVDSTKFGRRAYVRTFGLDAVKTVVSEKQPPSPLREVFNDYGVEVLAS